VHNFDWSLSQKQLTLFALSFAFVFSLGSNATWLEKLELFPRIVECAYIIHDRDILL
jgi:hypothetical protein